VRRRALPHPRRARSRLDLPLPHVPEGIWRFLRAVDRGFCENCGTPLTYRTPVSLDIAIGAFDERGDLAPQVQVNHAVRIPWVEQIFDAPVHGDAGYYVRQEQIISFQHPDQDTENWPEKGLHL
jgi:hypothetical protein